MRAGQSVKSFSYFFVVLVVVGSLSADRAFCQGQYKQIGRNAVLGIVQGKYERVERRLSAYLKKHPKDAESLFCTAALWSRKGNGSKALAAAERALAAGLPLERFCAGPRGLLGALMSTEAMQKRIARRGPELLHGPLLGCVTDRSARFWVRTFHEVPVLVEVYEAERPDRVVAAATGRTDRKWDYTARVVATGLRPATQYQYELSVRCVKVPGTWRFRTFPPEGAGAVVRVGFGGGAGYTPWHERMWLQIQKRKLDAFLFLGDNVYIDCPTEPAVQRYCYYRRQSRREFRSFTAETPVYAIWDDHDFVTNDKWGGPQVDTPPWKRKVWHVFQENWNNPAYGGGQKHPGCWFTFSVGDVQFIMLDGRYVREDPRTPRASMLGPVQKAWLYETLRASRARFKVLASPVPWAEGTKPGSRDTWDGFPEEREEIFSFIERNRIGGVVLLSADRHRSDVWRIPRPKGYDLYEFESSRLTNVHRHRAIPKALFSYNATCSFGELTFVVAGKDPRVTYRIITIDGEVVHQFRLPLSKLSPP